jgi:hypothetical protein
MGLILWIDGNTFASSLIEKVFKKKGLPFYTLAKVDDFAYLIDDLRPVAIVLDAQTAIKHLDVFQKQYEASESLKKTAFIIIDNQPGLDFIQNRIGEIKKPLDPFGVPTVISKMLGQLS